MKSCTLCPHACGKNREAGEVGVCRMTSEIFVAKAAPHFYEEPPISGTRGSGAVFFSGCSLSCLFCQNKAISRGATGRKVGEGELKRIFLDLAASGVHNLNLVTATHYTDAVARVLRDIKPQLNIPVVWNSSGYESPETLRLLEGLVDIYLPDFKYADNTLATALSGAPDYSKHACLALAEMYRQTGKATFDENGLLKKGMVVRHLVLPGHREDSAAVLRLLADTLPTQNILLSLMRQYTPDFAPPDAPQNLKRRLTTFEYQWVANLAAELGFVGFLQEKDAANAAYTPDFTE